jgi:peptidoglycan LD-endopeptidase CwlK
MIEQLQRQLIAVLQALVLRLQSRIMAKYPTQLYPAVARKRDELIRLAAKQGMDIRVTEDVRSCARQNELYAQGRTTQGPIVTNARCGESFHNYGIAFDVVFRDLGYNGPWGKLGALGKGIGLEWGGDWEGFTDRPHFQLTLGYTLADFQESKVDYSKFR